MNKLFKVLTILIASLGLVIGVTSQARAAVIIDSAESGSSGVVWGYNGNTIVLEMDGWITTGISTGDISISVDSDSLLSTVIKSPTGTSFSLSLDGNELVATSSYDGGSYYFAKYEGVALSAGNHTLTISHNDASGGYAYYNVSISRKSRGDGSSAVPEPATLVLLGTGLIGAAGVRRRRQQKARAKAAA